MLLVTGQRNAFSLDQLGDEFDDGGTQLRIALVLIEQLDAEACDELLVDTFFDLEERVVAHLVFDRGCAVGERRRGRMMIHNYGWCR